MRSQRQQRQAAFALIVASLLASVVLAACSSTVSGNAPVVTAPKAEKPPVPPGGVLLQGAGATFPSLLYKKWFAGYQQQHPDTVVAYEAVGSGEGIRRFMGQGVADEDRVDFGASDAAMQDEQMAKVQAGTILLPVTRRRGRARLQHSRALAGA